MIHYTENNTLEMEGIGGDILVESNIIAVHVIKSLIECGFTKKLLLKYFINH